MFECLFMAWGCGGWKGTNPSDPIMFSKESVHCPESQNNGCIEGDMARTGKVGNGQTACFLEASPISA